MTPAENTGSNDTPEAVPERILSIAGSEFSEKGFEGARMDTIADKANVNKATLYYHFENKNGLYESVILQPLEEIAGGLEQPPNTSDSRERLNHWMLFVVKQIRSHPKIANLLLREIVDGGNRLSEDVRELIGEVWGYFRGLLEDCRDNNDCTEYPLTNIQRTIVGSILMNSLDTAFFESVTGEDSDAADISDEQLVDLLLSGLIEP